MGEIKKKDFKNAFRVVELKGDRDRKDVGGCESKFGQALKGRK